ncbi:hypothetical protein C8J57DRAFT_1225146 [Mycena rebaudengoi]|nr:hypothetical protein C8J57DRAFT_1225146 [Mycena rebaudengoi]
MEARQAKKAWGRARIARGVGPRGRRTKKGGRLRQQRQGSPWGCDWFCSRMALMILSRPSSVMMMKGEAEGVAAGAAWAFVGPAIGAVKGAGAAGGAGGAVGRIGMEAARGFKGEGRAGNPAEEGLGANREEEEEALGKEEAAVGKKGEAVVCGRDPLRLTGGRAEGGVGMKGGRREEGPATGGTGGGFSGRAGDPRGSAPSYLDILVAITSPAPPHTWHFEVTPSGASIATSHQPFKIYGFHPLTFLYSRQVGALFRSELFTLHYAHFPVIFGGRCNNHARMHFTSSAFPTTYLAAWLPERYAQIFVANFFVTVFGGSPWLDKTGHTYFTNPHSSRAASQLPHSKTPPALIYCSCGISAA